MKKSEIIEILEEAIHDNYDYCPVMGTTYNYEGILNRLQEAGMQPPETVRTINEYHRITDNIWDKEDE